MPNARLDPAAQRLVFDVSKQLVTLSVAAIGVITGLKFTTFKGTEYILSAQISLFSFLLCATVSLLGYLRSPVAVDELPQGPARRHLDILCGGAYRLRRVHLGKYKPLTKSVVSLGAG